MDIHKTSDVYGIQRDVPLNYVPRDKVDTVFVDSLTRARHIVVYGSSKQGKTSLRKFNLKPDEYIAVTCPYGATIPVLFSSILKEAGFAVEQSSTRTVTGTTRIQARAGAGINLGVVNLAAGGAGETTAGEELSAVSVNLELDPSDVNDIIRALESVDFDKYIVLEDFHYLPTDTQAAFASALKAFHERSQFIFIVVGVWLDQNRLVQYNGDLTGRVLSVDADAWTHDELMGVIQKGEKLLNILLEPTVATDLVNECFENVYIVQEACYRLCESNNVFETQTTTKIVGADAEVTEVVLQIINEQSARYDKFVTYFSEGFQETTLQMYKWILLPVLTASSRFLETGLELKTVRKIIDANHPSAPINEGNLAQALDSLASLQVKKKIAPIVLDYDQTRRRLDVVDRGFLIWLNYQDREVLRESLNLPSSPILPEGITLGL